MRTGPRVLSLGIGLAFALTLLPASLAQARPGGGRGGPGGWGGRGRRLPPHRPGDDDREKWREDREAEREKERAERALVDALETTKTYFAIPWIKADMPTVDGNTKSAVLQATLKILAEVKTGAYPTLVFFYTEEEEKGEPTRAAEACTRVREEALEAAVDKEHVDRADCRVPLAARFFDCILVNVSDVSAKDNRFISTRSVPLVVLADAKGAIKKTFTRVGQCKPRTLLGAMLPLLKDEHPDLKHTLAAANEEAIKAIKAQVRLNAATLDPADAGRALVWTNTEARTNKVLDQYVEAEKEVHKAKRERYAALKEIYFLLQEAGLRQKAQMRLPERPVDPDLAAALDAVHKLLAHKPEVVTVAPAKEGQPSSDLKKAVAVVASGVARDAKPGVPFLFLFSAGEGPEGVMTRQSDRSEALRADLFEGEVNEEALGRSDFTTAIVARLFNARVVDVTAIEEKRNPAVNAKTAPVTTLADPAGQVLKAFPDAKACSSAAVYSQLKPFLNGADCAKQVAQADRCLRRVLEAEYERHVCTREQEWLDGLRAQVDRPVPDRFRRFVNTDLTKEVLHKRSDEAKRRIRSAETARDRAVEAWNASLEQIVALGVRKQEGVVAKAPPAPAPAPPEPSKPAPPPSPKPKPVVRPETREPAPATQPPSPKPAPVDPEELAKELKEALGG